MSFLLVVNPGSRGGRSSGLHHYWSSALESEGIPFEVVRTKELGDAREAAREPGPHHTVVAVGGDGTINEVLDGILLSGRKDLDLGVLYAGTSPDFCRFHRIPTDPEEALIGLIHGPVRAVDAVRIRYAGEGGDRVTGHFGCSCSVGLGAAVATTSNGLRPRLGDTAGTGLAVLGALLRGRPLELQVTADGETLSLSRVNHLMILKNPFIASGLKLDVELGPDDGRLCLVAAHGRSRTGMLRLLPGFYTGKAVRAPGVHSRFCTKVSLEAPADRSEGEGQPPLEFDGDPHGTLPVEVEILPKALQLRGGGHD